MATVIATLSRGSEIRTSLPSQTHDSNISIQPSNSSSDSPDVDSQHEPTADHSGQTVVEIIIVFGAMLVAAIAIILITVYISKLRKRQNQQQQQHCDAEAAQQQTQQPTNESDINNKETELAFPEYKQSLWRKTVRSFLLRLRGQEQHKDVYVIPDDLRAQLKQMYVY